MIYFDNAATQGFKPKNVILANENANKYLLTNAGRSSHKLAVMGEEFIYKTRKKLSEFFNLGLSERVIFTKNCTEALNLAIFGLVKPNSQVITTVTEHNSVLRPLYSLKNKNVSIKFISPKFRKITVNDIIPHISNKTSMVIVNAVSNVNGEKNDFEDIGNAINYRIPYLVDAAQAAGHIEIDMNLAKISCLAVAGHKGLNALQGASALLFSKHFDISPTFFGGSGTESFLPFPTCYPELLECGTLNLPAICSLFEGVVEAENNLSLSKSRLTYYTDYIISKLEQMNNIKIYSTANPFGIVAFSLLLPSGEVAELYSEKYDIALRGGYHCAPLMHKFLQTEKEGLIRVSLSINNTLDEIESFLSATKQLSKLS